MTVENQKSLALRVKAVIGHKAWRLITRPAAVVLRMLPQSLLYSVGLKLRRGSYPYKLIQEGDVVVQVGAPFDLLRIGRSRAVFFSMLVGKTGKAFIFEPEPNSAAQMTAYVEKAGLSDRVIVVPKGCWHEDRVLRFWSNPAHPASNLFEDVSEWPREELEARGYVPSEIPVTTIDSVLQAHGVTQVRVLSVTTNGSEQDILKGAGAYLKDDIEYLALADTGPEIHALSEQHGFQNVALDDRGYTSVRTQSQQA